MNVYSTFFAGKLGYKDEETARKSVALSDHLYRQFALAEDCARRHHALPNPAAPLLPGSRRAKRILQFLLDSAIPALSYNLNISSPPFLRIFSWLSSDS
jgi:hypothetical protein